MVERLCLVLLVLLAIPLYLLLGAEVWQQQGEVRRSAEASYVIPSRYSQVLALEHRGLLSDYLLLKTINFFGERVMHDQPLGENDWAYVVGSLNAVTDLDPYFLDPYLLAEGLLTWESGRYEEANRFLKKGMKYRPHDWQMPFYIGFNYFFFLEDNEKGAEYLLEAARRPDSPAFLPDLAARISYYGGKARDGAVFLKGIIAQSSDEQVKSRLSLRLKALEAAMFLEDLVDRFSVEQGRAPKSLDELTERGYVDRLPPDPYGGDWVLMESGRVFSTSRFLVQ